MLSFKAVIIDPIGMHARPTSKIVTEVSKLKENVEIKTVKGKANLKSIMNVMALGIKKGDEFEVIIDSEDKSTLEKIKKLFVDSKLI